MVNDMQKLCIAPLLYCFTFALAGCSSMAGRNRMQNQLADRAAAAAADQADAAVHANPGLAVEVANVRAVSDNSANVASGIFHINTVDQYRNAAVEASNAAAATEAAYRLLTQSDNGLLTALADIQNATNVFTAELAHLLNINPDLAGVVDPLAAQLPVLDQYIVRLRAGARRARSAERAYHVSAEIYRLINGHFGRATDRVEEVSHL